ncbi:antibiotic biosynthesis monooxygenase [Vagococcus sp. BWB3-3]|uniref:Antibiotic biosynthesis monooxygenase n=1 Tax=Vagococcus allomyrinae TaxID=2794353 RepID=A0A940SWE1_9ENTE|nr:antibiotic biosynthesis monooxygenase [Vagococcus allomyrinae]MBP1043215.1 antibiotic biosynthesis monooxygenase [Vagococcus allomyrinae]
MFIVTNTIRTEKPATAKIIEKFAGGHATASVTNIKGFLGFELWQKEAALDYDEIVVVSKWVEKADQKAWLKSEGFKKAHGRTDETRHEKPKTIGIISNEIEEFYSVLTQNPIEE